MNIAQEGDKVPTKGLIGESQCLNYSCRDSFHNYIEDKILCLRNELEGLIALRDSIPKAISPKAEEAFYKLITQSNRF